MLLFTKAGRELMEQTKKASTTEIFFEELLLLVESVECCIILR
jgi:hypothetical protein